MTEHIFDFRIYFRYNIDYSVLGVKGKIVFMYFFGGHFTIFILDLQYELQGNVWRVKTEPGNHGMSHLQT